jgi:hypothetical protein
MNHGHLIGRAFRIGACAATIAFCAAPVGSQDKPTKKDKRACAAAYKSAQERQQANHLREARDLYLACKKAACSKAIRQQCTASYIAVAEDIPTVVPLVTDDQGTPRVDVQVTMDGEFLATRLDGQAYPVDPGIHELSFSTLDGGVFATQKLVVAQGQRNRTVSATFSDRRGKKALAASTIPVPPADRAALEPRAPAEKGEAEGSKPSVVAAAEGDQAPQESASATPPSASSGGPGPLPYVIGGAGLAAIGAGALFIAWGNKDNDKLGQCAPFCSQASVDRVSTLYTTANISIGVGAAALGVATYLFLTSGSNNERPPSRVPYAFDLQPTPSGAFATVSGAF